MGEFVSVQPSGGLATIRLNRPPVNALSIALQSELKQAAEQVGADHDVRAVVLYGGGLELALCADFRVAGENARFGVPEILLGVIPGLGGTQRLPRLIGPARAKDLVYTGRLVSAEEALRIGLVDQVVPDAGVYEAATAMAGQFVSGPALALRAAKAAIDTGLDLSLEAGLEVERLHFTALFATEDQKLGMESFVASGPGQAKFTGK